MTDWISGITALAGLDDAATHLLATQSRPVTLKKGTRIFDIGSPCEAFLMMLAGYVRVQKTGMNGREIVLYRVGPGQTCIVTTACLMAGLHYDAEGIAETVVECRMVPTSLFRTLLGQSAAFRDFIFKAYGSRISDLLALIGEVRFVSLEARLASWLLARCGVRGVVHTTHHMLAADLGTAREVVSRRLKQFEHQGLVTLQRGKICVRQAEALAKYAEEHGM